MVLNKSGMIDAVTLQMEIKSIYRLLKEGSCLDYVERFSNYVRNWWIQAAIKLLKLASMDVFRQKYFDNVDYMKNEMKRFPENDDVLNVVSALDSNSPFFLSTEILINLAKKYSLPLQLDLVRLKFQAEVARNTSLAN